MFAVSTPTMIFKTVFGDEITFWAIDSAEKTVRMPQILLIRANWKHTNARILFVNKVSIAHCNEECKLQNIGFMVISM